MDYSSKKFAQSATLRSTEKMICHSHCLQDEHSQTKLSEFRPKQDVKGDKISKSKGKVGDLAKELRKTKQALAKEKIQRRKLEKANRQSLEEKKRKEELSDMLKEVHKCLSMELVNQFEKASKSLSMALVDQFEQASKGLSVDLETRINEKLDKLGFDLLNSWREERNFDTSESDDTLDGNKKRKLSGGKG